MDSTDRRTFLKAAGATLAASALTTTRTTTTAAEADAKGSKAWRKAFMLGGVSRGPILPQFELLKEAGFEGVELISPNNLDRDEVLRARDKTGIIIHGVSGSRHWRDT